MATTQFLFLPNVLYVVIFYVLYLTASPCSYQPYFKCNSVIVLILLCLAASFLQTQSVFGQHCVYMNRHKQQPMPVNWVIINFLARWQLAICFLNFYWDSYFLSKLSLSTVCLIMGIDKKNYSFCIFDTSNNHLKTDFCQKYQLKCIHTTLIIL